MSIKRDNKCSAIVFFLSRANVYDSSFFGITCVKGFDVNGAMFNIKGKSKGQRLSRITGSVFSFWSTQTETQTHKGISVETSTGILQRQIRSDLSENIYSLNIYMYTCNIIYMGYWWIYPDLIRNKIGHIWFTLHTFLKVSFACLIDLFSFAKRSSL